MGRARRYINAEGQLLCPLCEQWIHISGYSTRKLLGGGEDFIEDVWFEQNGIEYGKPQGYCKPCMSACSRGKAAMAVRKEKVRLELGGEPTPVTEKVMSFRDQMDELMRSVTPEEMAVETERIERLYGPPPSVEAD